MQARAPERGLAGQFYDNTTDWDLATSVTVSAGQTTANIDFSLAAGGSISGTVYEADGVTPVPNADVWADSYDCCGGGNGTRTSNDGTYTIDGLTSGDYRVQARAPERGLAGQFYDNTTDWDLATSVTVTAGQTTANIDFALAAGGTISGTVYEADGVTPVPNADVWADSYDCCGGGNGTRTSNDGTYTIDGLTSGDYRVQARAPERGLAGQFYDNTTDWDLATSVTVTAGQTTANIDFALAAGGTISGTVYEADGVTPIGDADVWAENYECCGAGNDTRISAEGTYTIDGLVSGDYRVRAQAQGHVREFYDNTTDWDLASSVSVTEGQTTANVDFALAAGGSISGTVYEADGVTPIGDADVWAENYECCGGGNDTRTSADGTYTIDGLASGDYRVRAQAQGHVRESYDNTTDWDLASSVSVTEGQTTANIDFALAVGGSISGTVYEADGVTPIADADVRAESYDCCGGGEGTRSAVDGTYTIDGLTSGDYRVRAQAQGHVREFYDNTTDWDLASSVTVSAGQTTANIDFALAEGGSISGTVYEADGVTPIADADVWAENYDCCGGGNGTRTSNDGTYTIDGLVSGDYRVRAQAQGHVREFYDNTTDRDLASSVSVTEGQTTANVDFALAAGGSISGTVYEADGVTPIGDADVWAENYECCGGGNDTRTSADGTYTIDGLASGDYRVRAQAQGHVREFYDNTTDWDLASSVSVTEGQTTANVDFALAVGGSISGTVYEADGVTPIADADVRAESYDCCGGGEGTRSAVDGTYTIDGLTSGDYRVRAQAQGHVREFYDNTTDWDLASSVTVSAGQTTANIDFALAEGGSISGTVYEADGVTPIADADVWAENYDCCGGDNGTRTSNDGTYTIDGLVSGDYRVRAQAQGHVREFYDNTTDRDLASSVSVTEGQTTANIDFALAAGGSISGTVYEADGVTPIADADVWAENYECCGGGNDTRTSADGTYTIDGLVSGDYRVRAQAQGHVREFYDNTTDWDLASKVSVTEGQITANIDFSLAVGGSISGTVYEADGVTPVVNAQVAAWLYDDGWPPSGSPLGSGLTTDDGTYTFDRLASGDYRVLAFVPGQNLVWEFYGDTNDPAAAVRVAVASVADSGAIDFTLEPGGSISGIVRKADGITPIEGIRVVAEDYTTGLIWGRAWSAANGTYTIFGLPASQFRVSTSDDKGLGYAQEFYNDVQDSGSAMAITVVIDADTPNIDFTLDAAP